MNPYQRLAAAVILRAVRDMCVYGADNTTAPNAREHKHAVIWLVSSRSSHWFDFAELSQSRILHKTKWTDYAQELLKSSPLTDRQREVLTEGVAILCEPDA